MKLTNNDLTNEPKQVFSTLICFIMNITGMTIGLILLRVAMYFRVVAVIVSGMWLCSFFIFCIIAKYFHFELHLQAAQNGSPPVYLNLFFLPEIIILGILCAKRHNGVFRLNIAAFWGWLVIYCLIAFAYIYIIILPILLKANVNWMGT